MVIRDLLSYSNPMSIGLIQPDFFSFSFPFLVWEL